MSSEQAPDWTDGNEHDPGPTVLELLAYVVGALLFTAGIYVYRRHHTRRRRTPDA